MSRFAAPIAEQIWELKYRFNPEAPGAAAGPSKPDGTVEDSWARVAEALAEAEAPALRGHWRDRFYTALEDFKYLPAGRILAGAGTERSVTLFNCFVMGTIPDHMGGIFEMLKEAALTMQQGGGIGYDFSTIRPKGARVEGVGSDASGPISFMDVWDSMCRTIMSAGARRGAMMATLRCDHPDIEAFIEAKSDPNRLRMFNLSVLVTDPFMAAVRADAPWDLTFGGETVRTVQACALWDKIMEATYAFAEPGVIFIDRINKRNNLHYCETISATNPCGEQPLPPYGACLLGSVNLARLVEDPFTPRARLDLDALADLTAVAVRMMDNVVDVSRFALEAQRREALAKRRIGLGVTGLADALLMMGVRYGSDAAVALTEEWLAALSRAAYLASVSLAKEKGPFPLFDAEAFLAGETAQTLDPDVRGAIAAHGLRNALLTSIAPTGTISLYAGNVSSGIEPIFAASYTRRVLEADGSAREEEVVDYALAEWRRVSGGAADKPPAFVSAQTLDPMDHVRMQAAAQKYIDSAISKTINVPETISFEAFKDVYEAAYDSGCKGCTTYRPNPVTGAVLAAADAPKSAEPEEAAADPTGQSAPSALNGANAPASAPSPDASKALVPPVAGGGDALQVREPMARPEQLVGATYKLKWPASAHAIYITINDIEVDGVRRPFEVFINSKAMEHYAWTVALTRMISAVFRRGGDLSFVVEELKAVFDPRGGAWMGGGYVPSLLAAIGGVIETHMRATGFWDASHPEAAAHSLAAAPAAPLSAPGAAPEPAAAPETASSAPPQSPAALPEALAADPCVACGSWNTRMMEGCATCLDCGHSRCS